MDPTDKTEAHVRRLWRHHGTVRVAPRRGPRPQLDLDEVLEAATAVADVDGLDSLSTRAVAGRLGISAMGLYPYVGSKDQLVALVQDHASRMPEWTDPATSLAEDLEEWALHLFDLYVVHPWLTEVSWAQSSGGPNEQDWLERLLTTLDRWDTPRGLRAAVVTTLYATVRASAQTSAAYIRLVRTGGVEPWLAQAAATRRLVADYASRYPQTLQLEQHAADWREAPRASVRHAVQVLCRGLDQT